VLDLSRDTPRVVNQYVTVLADRQFAQGDLAPIWDSAVEWIRQHTGRGERIFIVGHDSGVQFLARIPPISRVSNGILELRSDELNQHALVLRLKERLMSDLEDDPPQWILLAAYDESWINKSGADSLSAFKPFEDFLRDRYDVVQSNLSSYVIFRRR
jgi:hypothetical protein